MPAQGVHISSLVVAGLFATEYEDAREHQIFLDDVARLPYFLRGFPPPEDLSPRRAVSEFLVDSVPSCGRFVAVLFAPDAPGSGGTWDIQYDLPRFDEAKPLFLDRNPDTHSRSHILLPRRSDVAGKVSLCVTQTDGA